MDPEFGNKQGGDVGGWDGNDEGGANNDGGARVGDEDDLEDMVRALGLEILLNSPKVLENLERVTKVSNETVYGVEKGCPTHWIFLSWVLPQPNSVPTNTYQAKKVISPLTMGVEKIHACPNHCIIFCGETFKSLDKCP